MRRLSTAILAAGLCWSLGSMAFAADMPIKAPPAPLLPSWAGFYAGIGGGFQSSQVNGALISDAAFSGGATINALAGCGAATRCALNEPVNGTAFRVAPFAGFNWQVAPQWVLGVEGDWGWTGRKTTLNGMSLPSTAVSTGNSNDTFNVRPGWDASIRARAGFLVFPTLMLYATAGPAWQHVELSSACSTATVIGPGGVTFTPPCVALRPGEITHSTDRLGWTAGAGAEAMLGGNWFARAEYRYADFGTISSVDQRSCPGAGTGSFPCIAGGTQIANYDVHLVTHSATFGLAYKFGEPGGLSGTGAAYADASAAAYKAPPVQTVPSWTGFYAGVGAGLRANDAAGSIRSYSTTGLSIAGFTFAQFCGFFPCANSEPLSSSTARIAPYVGYNWQATSQWLFGIEADWGWGDRTTALSGVDYPGTNVVSSGDAADSFSVRTTWDASLRGRAGFLVTPRLLAYGTGGATWLHVESTSICASAFLCGGALGQMSPATITNATTRLGWTLGGGAEMLLWDHWIARAEYRYADYGTISNTNSRGVPGFVEIASYDVKVKTHTATFGLAYKFD
jgi:outer membrane immunogenic protein